MRKDPPVSTQLPEWKKEVAEKVKAYGERKKRLTTPPHPLKDNQQAPPPADIPVRQTILIVQEAEKVSHEPQPPEIQKNLKHAPIPPVELVPHPAIEIWTDDIPGLAEDEVASSAAPYMARRLLAGLIDHAILVLISLLILFGFSAVMGESMKLLVLSSWKGTLSLFLLIHFLYHLYFFRSSRQTPGMLFVSLELRDPVISVIPVDKIIVRWFSFVLFNIFNLVPLVLGKAFLLHDRLSGTEVRSFN